MNAVEIIEEIKRLPEVERAKVHEFILKLPNAETVAAIEEPVDNLTRYKTISEVRAAVKDIIRNA
jgi:hypothetical protein